MYADSLTVHSPKLSLCIILHKDGQGDVSLDLRVACGLDAALRLYNVPETLRNQKIQKIIAMDYSSFGRKILSDFKDYITAVNWQAVETTRQKMLAKSKKEVLT